MFWVKVKSKEHEQSATYVHVGLCVSNFKIFGKVLFMTKLDLDLDLGPVHRLESRIQIYLVHDEIFNNLRRVKVAEQIFCRGIYPPCLQRCTRLD